MASCIRVIGIGQGFAASRLVRGFADLRLVPAAANQQPALAVYTPAGDSHQPGETLDGNRSVYQLIANLVATAAIAPYRWPVSRRIWVTYGLDLRKWTAAWALAVCASTVAALKRHPQLSAGPGVPFAVTCAV